MSGRTLGWLALAVWAVPALAAAQQAPPAYLLEWGTPGVGDGQLTTQHGVAVAGDGDREAGPRH